MDLMKVITVVGPTASGKSDLAIAIARAIHGVVISVDSRQVYRGMNLGTGKVMGQWQSESPFPHLISEGVSHYGLDLAEPMQEYTVADFQNYIDELMPYLQSQNLPVVFCGGTGFWLDAVVRGLSFPAVPPNPQLRAELERLSTLALFEKLESMDANRAGNIDRANRPRLIRAIEIATGSGGIVPAIKVNPKYSSLWFGIEWSPELLRQRIHTRLNNRLMDGMIAEVQALQAQGVSWSRLYGFGLEYRAIAHHLQWGNSVDDMAQGLGRDIWQYAKRQYTWFRRHKDIQWLQGESLPVADVISKVETWLA